MGNVDSLITTHIDTWTSAIKVKSSVGRGSSNKRELYGIRKLRELILELAVRGLLVPQNSSNEPASELLRRVADEKTQLVKDKKIARSKPLPPVTEEEKPFDLPKGWEVARVGDLTSKLGSGSTPRGGKNAYVTDGIPFLRSQNVWNDGLKLDDIAYIPEETHSKMEKTKVFPGDVLLNITGASLGRTTIFPESLIEANVSQHVTIIRLIEPKMAPFLHLGIMSPMIQKLVWGRQVGMAIEGLSKKVLELFEFPIPPLAEQFRILSKVQELMVICDKLEQQTDASIDTHETLVSTLLKALTDSAERSDNGAQLFQQAWERIVENFDLLFTTESSIDQLKQTILQLAMMGKLVPQDPSDEPASVLLDQVAAQKEQLIKEKKIRKQKPQLAIENDDVPFNLPEGWKWSRFFEANTVRSDLVPALEHPNQQQVAPDVIEKNTGRLLAHRTVAEAGAKGPNNRFSKGQLLYSKIRPSLNKVVIAPYDGLCSADMYPIDSYINSSFVLYSMLSESFLVQVRAVENRVKMPKLNLDSLGKFLVPIPPLSEQQRIAERISELFSLCDLLKSNIRDAQSIKVDIADSITKQAIV